MNVLSRLFGRTFRQGVRPPEYKETGSLPIRRLPFAPRMVVPLAQHFGKPSMPVVRKGQEVVRGEPLAVADGFMSVPVHAPVTGVVEGIELMPTARGPKAKAILLRTYEGASQQVLYGAPRDVGAMSRDEVIAAVQETGLVGLGGAAFPTHVKLSVPPGHAVDTLIVNGCECEPFLTTDHRVMLERPAEVMAGIRIALRATGARKALIGVEDNKPDAVAALRGQIGPGDPVQVVEVESKYPQGSEKLLIQVLLGREVPSGGLPYQVGVVVNNVGTLAQMGTLLPRGEGLIERIVTVAGPGIAKPGNYLVPLGTPLRFLLDHVGYRGDASHIILGGPMMGNTVSSLDVPVVKGASGVVVLPDEHASETHAAFVEPRIHPCIRCGACLKACPVNLNPAELGRLAARRMYDVMEERFHLNDCFECGCCSYVCPSSIPLVQYFRIAKAVNRERRVA